MSRRARPSRALTLRFGMSARPARGVRFDQTLGVATQSFADLEDGPELVVAHAPDTSTAVGSARDLIEVAPDRTQLTYGLLQRDQFVVWQWSQGSQVRSHEHRHVRGRGHAPRRRALVQQ